MDHLSKDFNALKKAIHLASFLRHGPEFLWTSVCGPVVAERTCVVEFVDGRIVVEISDESWRKELESLVPEYLARMNECAPQKISSLILVAKGTYNKQSKP